MTHKREYDYSVITSKYNINIEDFVCGKWKEIKGNSFFAHGLRVLLNYLLIYPDIQPAPLLQKTLRNKFGDDLLISIAAPYPVH
jgi:hypothetical protein